MDEGALSASEQVFLKTLRQVSAAFPGSGVSARQIGARMNLGPGEVVLIAMALEARGLLTFVGDPSAVSTVGMRLTRLGMKGPSSPFPDW